MKKLNCKILLLFSIFLFCFGNAVTVQAKTTTISKKNFPDGYIRKVLKKYDKNHDGRLSNKEQKKVDELTINKRKQVDLKGIRKLKYLSVVNLHKVKVKNVTELAHVKRLEYLDARNANFQYLRLKNAYLKGFEVDDNSQLLSVNLSGCSQLKDATFIDNKKLKTLDFHNCKQMKELTDQGNTKLAKVNVMGASKLSRWEMDLCKGKKVQMNKLEDLWELKLNNYDGLNFDFSKTRRISDLYFNHSIVDDSTFKWTPNLSTLECDECKSIKPLNFSKLGNLYYLYAFKCQFGSSLDLTGLKNLTELSWEDNATKTISFGNANQLSEVYLDGNKFKGDMNFGMLKKLEELSVYDNALTSINTNGCPNLRSLCCTENKLLTLDLRECKKIRICDAEKNPNLELFIYCDANNYYDRMISYDNTAIIHYFDANYED